LFGDVLQLPFGKHSGFGNLVSGAIRLAHGSPDFYSDTSKSASPGHVYPPFGTVVIWYRKKDYAIVVQKKHPGNAGTHTKQDCSRCWVDQVSTKCGHRKKAHNPQVPSSGERACLPKA
jgi:hypothetical protein